MLTWRGVVKWRALRPLLAAIAMFVGGASLADTQIDGTRLAILIANSNYPDASSPQQFATKDVTLLADELSRDSFDVDLRKDLTRDDMRGAIDAFLAKIKPGATALIYFNGIGIQVARQTYLIPVNAEIWSEADVKREGISIDAVVADMSRRGAYVKIIIVDAARRNPFERRFRAYSAGLASLDAPENTLVMYAAAPNKVAADGTGDVSLFMNELVKELRTPKISAEDAIMHTRVGVSRASNGEQVPWFASSLVDPIYLGQPAASPPKTQQAPPEAKVPPVSVAKTPPQAPPDLAAPPVQIAKTPATTPPASTPPAVTVPPSAPQPSTPASPPLATPAPAAPNPKPIAKTPSESGTPAVPIVKAPPTETPPTETPPSQTQAAETPTPETPAHPNSPPAQIAKAPEGPAIVAPAPNPPDAASKPEDPAGDQPKVFRDCPDCPEMTTLGPDSFLMGAGSTPFDRPPHRVTFDRPFAVAVSEVTFADWGRCLADGGCSSFKPDSQGFGEGDHPVINISWTDAKDFVAWLSRKTGKPYRLPSEAEWEYAARGGSKTAFSWGPAVGTHMANCADCGAGGGTPRTTAVKSFPPNAYGLYDMAGNAAEWVEDCWNPSYRGAPKDGSAWVTGTCEQRVLRGGSFDSSAAYVKPSARFRYDSDVRYWANGFRVARDLP